MKPENHRAETQRRRGGKAKLTELREELAATALILESVCSAAGIDLETSVSVVIDGKTVGKVSISKWIEKLNAKYWPERSAPLRASAPLRENSGSQLSTLNSQLGTAAP